MSYEYSGKNWLESWIAEGHPIEGSEYYAEKLDSEPLPVSTARVRAPRARRNAYITNREHKRRIINNFLALRTSECEYFFIYRHVYAPYFLFPSGKCVNLYSDGTSRRGCALDAMRHAEGRIVPSLVYVKRANNPIYYISPKCKREVKRHSNRVIRRYSGEIGRGRHAHRLTARYYDIQLF